MGAALLIVLWLLAIVGLVVLLALVLPVRLELEVRKEAEWRVLGAVRLFGRHGPRIPFRKSSARQRSSPKRAKRERAKSRDPRALFPAALRFLTDVLGCIHVGRLTVNARVGLGDPALTGQAFGMLCPVVYGAPAITGVRVQVVPVFDRPILQGAADVALSVVPITLLGPIVRFGWHIFGPAR